MAVHFDIRVDITDAVALDQHLEIAASVYLPGLDLGWSATPVVFAFPGGTYGRSYYDLHVPGHSGYSFADHLTRAGYIVVTIDHVGIGESTPYEPFSSLTKEIVVSADRAAVEQILIRLSDGTLTDQLAPIEKMFKMGVGHSMGGSILTRLQANYNVFDAIAILGSSVLRKKKSPENAARYKSLISNIPDTTRPSREIFHKFFYDERVPADVIAADDAHSVRIYTWMFQRKEHGIQNELELAKAASRIDVPVFLGFGSRDISPNPRREVSMYMNAVDITVFVLPNSAHCFNFAESRNIFFDRLGAWGLEQLKTYGEQGFGR